MDIQVFALANELGVSVARIQEAQRDLGLTENRRSEAWIPTRDADIIRRYLGDASRAPIDHAEIQRRRVEKARREIEAQRRRE
jgi:hypothetical protein